MCESRSIFPRNIWHSYVATKRRGETKSMDARTTDDLFSWATPQKKSDIAVLQCVTMKREGDTNMKEGKQVESLT